MAETNEYRGIVTGSLGGLFTVECTDGSVFRCPARGVFRRDGLTVTVGDRVAVRTEPDGSASLTDVEERKNLLARPPLANLDVLFVTFAAAHPVPVLETIDRLTTIAVHNDVEPVIVVTKAEKAPSEAAEYADIYSHTPFPVFVTSAFAGTGLEELRRYLAEDCRGKLCAFAGASGVGKSTLLTALLPHLSLAAGELSKIGRGRHTTRSVDLYPLVEGDPSAGRIADTPGFSALDFTKNDYYGLDSLCGVFPEFGDYLGKCRYTKCTHTKEEGCAILEAVRKGDVSPRRHASYVSLREELKKKRAWD